MHFGNAWFSNSWVGGLGDMSRFVADRRHASWFLDAVRFGRVIQSLCSWSFDSRLGKPELSTGSPKTQELGFGPGAAGAPAPSVLPQGRVMILLATLER